ncbi:hypothetical protein BDA96_07G063000 [Sorghum bicolor]|uniref:Uncharacterized protein n=2 Tax=Sorghum bicolor TaxID=4558 RepID=A0A921U9K9_SORBI|nr:hypothetical protein BDA96_07G063000 [Sorghum bicolor]KAG0522732.1 hypothetical protein BDA96_07G063000 [Sorghum bicolor]OQU79979.1 hypothetical protein SORBI_3007G060201 [Sorghum bicolor]OQU79980.1 hypothetical protein SORBI_3007G060201 [Sorghum bicolor]
MYVSSRPSDCRVYSFLNSNLDCFRLSCGLRDYGGAGDATAELLPTASSRAPVDHHTLDSIEISTTTI